MAAPALRSPLAATAVAVLLVACTPAGDPSPSPDGGSAPTGRRTAPPTAAGDAGAPSPADGPTADGASADGASADVGDVTIGDLHAGTVALLEEQVLLTAAMTDAALRADGAAAAAALAGLRDDVAAELAAGLAPVYGPDAVAPLRQRFAGQADGLLTYATAVAAGDPTGAGRARAALGAEVAAAASLLEELAQLPAGVSTPLLRDRVDALTAVVDAQAVEDGDEQALELLREARVAQDPLAAAVAEAVGAQNGLRLGAVPVPLPRRTAAEDARSLEVGLGGALLEHAHLTARATGAAVEGRDPAVEAALASLADGNAEDLGSALGTGDPPEDPEAPRFADAWGATAEGLVDHARARAAGDDAAVAEAAEAIGEARARAAAALEAATGGALTAAGVEPLLEERLAAARAVADLQAAGDDAGAVAALRATAAGLPAAVRPLVASLVPTAGSTPLAFGATPPAADPG